MAKDFIPELFISSKKAIKSHLELAENHRILFSAPFGAGKSTFLRSIFHEKPFLEEEEMFPNYLSFHLYPINYSVASNEDIFTAIKFDIVCSLIENNEILDGIKNKPSFKRVGNFILNKSKDIVEASSFLFNGFLGLPPIKWLSLFSKLNDIGTDLKKANDVKSILTAFKENALNSSVLQTDDEITLLIRQAIVFAQTPVSEGGLGKKCILIIDDIDRIDPEHIFRILNVFAAHYDINLELGNRFGFHQVMVVCDIENVRSIFHHMYGMKTSFTGYIDKFYSVSVFEFDITMDVIPFIETWVENMFTSSRLSKNQNFPIIAHELSAIIKDLYLSGCITIRQLLEKENQYDRMNLNYNCLINNSKRFIDVDVFPVYIVLNVLSRFLGGISNMRAVFELAMMRTEHQNHYTQVREKIKYYVFIIDPTWINRDKDLSANHRIRDDKSQISFSYKVKDDFGRLEASIVEDVNSKVYLNTNQLLLSAVDRFEELHLQ